MAMRGLTMFISDIRQCSTKEQEQRRINKELGKIRSKFSQSNIAGYDLKKYVWKIIYMMLLGVEIDFGHMEAVNLISSNKYSEKNVGYVACTLMLNEKNDILRLIIQSIKNDLTSKNENMQCLALTCIANVGGEEFAESLASDVQKLLISGSSRNFVRKKAALSLLRLFRKYPEILQVESWAPRIVGLLDNANIGVLTSVMSLLLGFVAYEAEPFEVAVPRCLAILAKLNNQECDQTYIHYSVACPWLQVKILKFLQYYPPPKSPTMYSRLLGQLSNMITELSKESSAKTKNQNRWNASYAVLFEVINLSMHLNLEGGHDLLGRVVTLLGKFVLMSETNLRYLAMECMSRLAKIPGTLNSIKAHQDTIIKLLQDNDIFLRKRALSMLFCMCDESNARPIVQELLTNLENAEYAIREEMVLKIAILVEDFSTDYKWYIDVVLQLITLAGDFVTDDIWHRIIQVVTNNEELQPYAAERVFQALCIGQPHETLVKAGGYILGEFGHLLPVQVATVENQLQVLLQHFSICSLKTKALLLSTFMKMANLHTSLKAHIFSVFQDYRSFVDGELQQRAVEYSNMLNHKDQELISQIWEMMPPFPERESSLLQIMKDRGGTTTERVPKQERDADEDSNEENEADDSDEDDDDDDDDEDDDDSNTGESDKSETDEDDSSDEEQNEKISQVQPDTVDLLDGILSSNSFASPVASQPSLTLPEQDMSKLRNTLLSGKGVVYECSFFQIGCVFQCTAAAVVKMTLYIGNKSSESLDDLKLTIAASSGLRADMRPVSITVQPRKQELMHIMWHIAQPIPPYPSSSLTFSKSGVCFETRLLMPVSICLFSSPVAMAGPAFIDAWKSYGVETKFTMNTINPLNIQTLSNTFTQSLRLAVLSNIDRNPNVLVCAAQLHYKGANQQTGVSPMLLRVETNAAAQALRVTTHTHHRMINAAIEATLKAAL